MRTFSAWAVEQGRRFGQVQIGAKSKQKTAIPALLDTLDVAGSSVTIDAIACQPSLVAHVVNAGADYLIALEESAKTRDEQAHVPLLARAPHLPARRSRSRAHGRAKTRTGRIRQDLGVLEACADWAGLRTLVLVETERCTAQGSPRTQRLYLPFAR